MSPSSFANGVVGAARVHPRQEVVARCRSRGVIVHVPVPAAQARALLHRGLELEPIPGLAEGQHLLRFDVAELSEGRGALAGVDNVGWSGGIAGLMGAAFGTLVLNPALGFKAGRAVGRTMATAAADRMSRYDELIVTVPNVRAARGAQLYQAVVGMRLNSELGQALERWGGYGYRKELAELRIDSFQSYRVRAGGRALLDATLTPGAWTSADAPGLAPFVDLGAQAFLSDGRGGGLLAHSVLMRRYGEMARAGVQLSTDDVVRGVGRHRFTAAAGAVGPLGAVVFEDAATALTSAHHCSAHAL